MDRLGALSASSLRIEVGEDAVVLSPTRRNIFWGALANFAKALILTLVVLLFLYVPDFVFDYSQRDLASIKGFGVYLLVILLIVAVIAFVVGVVEASSCVIDKKKRTVCGSKSVLGRTTAFRDIREIYVEPSFLFGPKRICAKVKEEPVVLLKVFASAGQIEEIKKFIQELIL